MKHIYIFCICLAVQVMNLSAQIFDNFDDGDFINQPAWVGNRDSFAVFNNQLRLNAASAGRSYLAVSSTFMNNQEWRIYVRFDLSPSLQNNCRFYLISNQQDLSNSLNGYYVQVGGSTGNTDTISLYRQDGLQRFRIIGGRPSTVSKSLNFVALKIRRDSTGFWDLMSDTTGGLNYISEGTAFDSTYQNSLFSGVLCQYTITNRQNFFFDNFYSGPFYNDTIPPVIDSLQLINSTQLLVRYSEPVSVSTAQDVTNYVLNGGVNPISATLQADQRTVLLTFSALFVSGQLRTLVCDGVQDLAGNVMTTFSRQFFYYEPGKKDIVLNELMADPSPIVSLPNAEFIELYNRSNVDINLKNWQLTDGSTTAVLPDVVLPRDSHLIICGSSFSADFSNFGRTVPVSSFPSLNNAGDKITLISNSLTVIDEVIYSDNWYADELKRQGGWTLELKNPDHPCSDSRNWSASIHPQGGTPGKQNSQFSRSPDLFPPAVVEKGYLQTSQQLYFVFDEKIDSSSFLSSQILISNGLIISNKILNQDTIFITVTTALLSGVTYTISFTGLKDCWGNQLINYQVFYSFVTPQKPLAFGVLLTEILSDEAPIVGLPDAEYVELYNNSPFAVDLSGWTISDATGRGTIPNYILDSGAYVILCSTSSVAKFTGLSNVLGVPSFPSLSNDGELLVLRNEEGAVIHFISYDNDWHSDALKKSGGWSLEMTDKNAYCVGNGNWQTSVNSAGGTPGVANSQQRNVSDKTKPELINSYLSDSVNLVVHFSKPIDSLSAFAVNAFTITPSLGSYIVYGFSADFTTLRIRFSSPVADGVTYVIRADSIIDCAGNMINSKRNLIRFALPVLPDSGDVVINELLFNPRSGGYDYVELYNRSTKVIDMGRLLVADADEQNSIDNFYRISDAPLLLFGGEYLVLTENAAQTKKDYRCIYPERIKEVMTLPGMSDDEGVCILIDSTGKRFDQVWYKDDWHHPQVDDKNGVSLEKINPMLPSQDKTSWTSASATSGYGTPGYENSQYSFLNTTDKSVFIAKDVFSPDGDGYDDELLIQYSLEKPGYSCTFTVYTAQGLFIKRVLNNELLGASGIIKWRGETESSGIALPGIYVLVFEFQHPDGNANIIKKTCVLALK